MLLNIVETKKNDFQQKVSCYTFGLSKLKSKQNLKRNLMNGNELNIYSNVINSSEPGLLQTNNQVLENFAKLVKQDIVKAVEAMRDCISGEDLHNLQLELNSRLSENFNRPKGNKDSLTPKRLKVLKSCFEEVSGDNVL